MPTILPGTDVNATSLGESGSELSVPVAEVIEEGRDGSQFSLAPSDPIPLPQIPGLPPFPNPSIAAAARPSTIEVPLPTAEELEDGSFLLDSINSDDNGQDDEAAFLRPAKKKRGGGRNQLQQRERSAGGRRGQK